MLQKRIAALLTGLALAGMFAGIVAADSQVETLNLTGGTLSETLNPISIPNATITGSDQTDAFPIDWTGNDATGSGAGWNLTVSQTPFTNGAPTPKYLETDTKNNGAQNTSIVTVSPATFGCTPLSSCTLATTSIATAVIVPAGTYVGNTYTAPTSAKLFNAALATGLGSEDFVSPSSLFISGSAYAGTYTSTMTVAIVSGP